MLIVIFVIIIIVLSGSSKDREKIEFSNNPMATDLLNTINDSGRLVAVAFTESYVELEYWKTDNHTTRESISYSKYGLKDLTYDQTNLFSSWVYNNMKLKEQHTMCTNRNWHGYDWSRGINCIYPKPREKKDW